MYKLQEKCPRMHPVIPASCIIVFILFMNYHRNELKRFFGLNSTDVTQSNRNFTAVTHLPFNSTEKHNIGHKQTATKYARHHRKYFVRQPTRRQNALFSSSSKKAEYKKWTDFTYLSADARLIRDNLIEREKCWNGTNRECHCIYSTMIV